MSAWASIAPSCRKPFIFQLPATSFVLIAIVATPLAGPYHLADTITPTFGRVNRPSRQKEALASMLQAIRSRAGSYVVKILFALLILTFGIWGIGDIFRNRGSDTVVATVNF